MKRIFAHRGVSSIRPENTMVSFNEVLNTKTDWLETDVSISSDEKIFILHDDYLDRTTNLSGAITDKTSTEIEQADAGSWFDSKYAGQKVPSLDDFFDFINQTKLNVNIELKSVTGPNANKLADSLTKQLSEKLNDLDDSIEIIISSFNPVMLLKLRQYRPDLKYAMLFEDHTFYDDWNIYMQATGSKIIHPQNEHLTKAQVKMFKDYGYEVNVWTVNSKDRANELFNWGVDGIFTDNAQLF